MENKEKVFCKYCKHCTKDSVVSPTHTRGCEHPGNIKTIENDTWFEPNHKVHIRKCLPSELNFDNHCTFFEPEPKGKAIPVK